MHDDEQHDDPMAADPAPDAPDAPDGPGSVPPSSTSDGGCPMNRRALLGAMGAGLGAAALVPASALAQDRGGRGRRGRGRGDGPGDGPGRPDGRPGDGGRGDGGRGDGDRGDGGQGGGATRFTRMFPGLPAFGPATREMGEALLALGAVGGVLDAGDDLAAGAQALGTDPALAVGNADNEESVAGLTFVGQFIDHDLTRDAGSRLGRPTPVRRSTNLRTPRFDLDSVYDGGPQDSPDLYAADGIRLLVESGGRFEDVPRHDDGSAMIGDPRNDENLMVCGLHAAMLRFHNAVADQMPSAGFAEVARAVRWHWQWLVLHEFLPGFVAPEVVAEVLTEGPRFMRDDRPRIPVEFQTSAYRFGHSLVRPAYLANLTGNDGSPFGGLVFDPTLPDGEDPDDLVGGHRAPRRFIDWQLFFDFGDGAVQRPKRIDTKLSSVLFDLPVSTIDSPRGEPVGTTSLAGRNLLRHLTWEVPSGQRIARAMGISPLSAEALDDLAPFGQRLQDSTPLWFYVLREAEVLADGRHLGPVGGRIVAEVFISLLQQDPGAWLRAEPDWTPTLEASDATLGFRMVDLLAVAGVDPATRSA